MFAVEHAGAEALIVFLKHGEGRAFGVGCQKIPVRRTTGMVYGYVAPVELGFGRAGAAGLEVGAVGVRQPQRNQVRFAQFTNGVQGWQVGGFANTAPAAANNFFWAEVVEVVKPELFGDIRLVAGKGLVKLVVVGQLQLCEQLVDCINVLFGDSGFCFAIRR